MDGIITDGFNNDSDMPFEVFDDVLSTFPRRISEDTATNNYGFRLLDFCKTVDVAIVNGRTGSDASIGKCTCKPVSVVDYVLVSSDLFHLISDLGVLDFANCTSMPIVQYFFNLILLKHRRRNLNTLKVLMMFVLRMLMKETCIL